MSYLWRRQWHPIPVLLPGKSHGRRTLVGCSPWSRKESDTTEQLHFYFSLSCIGEGNGNPLQYSCLENSMDREAWRAMDHGVAKSQIQLKWLSSSSRVGKGNQTCLPFLVYGITSTFLPRGWWSFTWWSQPIFLALTVISFPWFYHGKEINIFSAHFLSLGSPLKYCSFSHVYACIWLGLLSIHRIKNAIAYLHWSIFTLMDDKLYLGLDDLDWGI